MSMPKFPDSEEILSRDEAINAILTSIAAEETALSHIMNAEGEKVQHALAHCSDMKMVIAVNESVTAILDRVVDLQLILKNKMRLAESFVETKPTKKCCCKGECRCQQDPSPGIPDNCKPVRVRCCEPPVYIPNPKDC